MARFVIRKTDLVTLRLVKTTLASTGPITVTHRPENNFITFPSRDNDGNRIVAYPLVSFGRLSGPKRFLSPILSETCDRIADLCIGGSSSDGRHAFWTNVNQENSRVDELFIRPLSFAGFPSMPATKIDRIYSAAAVVSRFGGADATETLQDNSCFFVYIKSPTAGSRIAITEHYPQQVDAATGNKTADPVILFRAREFLGSPKVAPRGHFVVFSDNRLIYLALDATGHPSGSPHVLVEMPQGQIGGVDLLPESSCRSCRNRAPSEPLSLRHC